MSAIPGGSIGFDVTARADSMKSVVDDAQKRVKQFADTTNRTKVVITPRIDLTRIEADAKRARDAIAGLETAASRARSRAGVSSSVGGLGDAASMMGGLGNAASMRGGLGNAASMRGGLGDAASMMGGLGNAASMMGGRGGGSSAGDGGRGILQESAALSQGIGRVAKVAVLATAAMEAVEIGWKVANAAAKLAVGETKEAAKLAADAGDAAKELPLLGNVVRPISRFLGFITGINKDIAKAEKDTATLDKKTEEMSQRVQVTRGVNAGMEGISKEEVARRKAQGLTPSGVELFAVQKQMKDLKETRQINMGRGFDEGRYKDAMGNLRVREQELKSRVAGEEEIIEREHWAKMAEIRDAAAAEQLRAAGFTIDAERELLIAGYNRTQQALQTEALAFDLENNPAAAARIREEAAATAALQALEVEAFDRNRSETESREREAQGESAKDDARRAGDAAQAKAEQRRAIANATSDTLFEARQEMLGRRESTRPRAEFEAINKLAERELRDTEDPELRKAILKRQGEQLQTLLNPQGGSRFASTEASSSASLRVLGDPSRGDPRDRAVENVLKTDILSELRKITAGVNKPKPALTS